MTAALQPRLTSGVILATLLSLAATATADPAPSVQLELEQTVISGNEELPKVLYILPWRQPDGRPMLPAPTTLVDDGLFRRLKPATHQRELTYLEHYRDSDRED